MKKRPAMSLADTHIAIGPALGERRAQSLAAARRRSRFVAGLRLALLAALALIALNLAVQILINGRGHELAAPDVPTGEVERIVNPRFTGRDAQGTPFVVTADSAVRQPGGVLGLTALENPRLDYALLGEAAGRSAVLAETGLYDPQARTLRLETDVSLSTRSDYEFETSSATLHLEESRITGDAPVYGEAPWRAIRAGGFEVREDGRHVIFTDGVVTRLIIDERAGDGAEEDTE